MKVFSAAMMDSLEALLLTYQAALRVADRPPVHAGLRTIRIGTDFSTLTAMASGFSRESLARFVTKLVEGLLVGMGEPA